MKGKSKKAEKIKSGKVEKKPFNLSTFQPFNLPIGILFLSTLVILNFLSPSFRKKRASLTANTIAKSNIVAPYTFYIKKPPKQLEQEQGKARESVPPIFSYHPDDKIKESLQNFKNNVQKLRNKKNFYKEAGIVEIIELIPSFDESDARVILSYKYRDIPKKLISVIDKLLKKGIVEEKDLIGPFNVIITSKGEEIRKGADILTLETSLMLMKEQGLEIFKGEENVSPQVVNTFVKLGSFFIKPNLFFNSAEVERRKKEAVESILPTKGIVLKGEMIVRGHEKITQDVIDKVASFTELKPAGYFHTFIGENIMFIIAFVLLVIFVHFIKPELLQQPKRFSIILVVSIIVMGISSVVFRTGLALYLIPVAMAGILICLLFSAEVALISVVFLTFIEVLFSRESVVEVAPLTVVVIGLATGVMAIFGASKVKRMSEFYKPLVYVTLTYIGVAISIEAVKGSNGIIFLKSMGYGVIGGFGSTFLAIGFLPLFERMFKITTDITLLEWTDFNKPLLRELAKQSPGTYNHSIMVGNLAEAGANSCNANTVLARVGAYYHDIGKINKPTYFIENQRGIKNPHDKLKPRMSALLIASHVRDGEELAKKHNIPQKVVDIIKEHHGTTLIESFYTKAKDEVSSENGKVVNEEDFRYPGPIPDTKESAIVMLADAVEARVRSLEEPSSSRIKGVIKDIFADRIKSGELAQSNLSMQELTKIKESFLPILIAAFHPRIPYKNEHNPPESKQKHKRQSPHSK